MDAKLPAMGVNSEIEFNTILFEKRLTGLKDSQESINSCCHWCLQNRQHHKKIVCCWLNVLKRVKIEHRLTLFYLANDVIQYSKRRNYDFVESWGTTLQKATTMVRDEKVKHKILRIFKIWEQRGIYGEEFLADLCGLISASPSARKGDEAHEFQSSYLIQKIRACSRMETDTDTKLRQLKEHNPKIQVDSESLIPSLKDRAHVDDVEKEVEDYTKQMENYINALKLEIKARIHLISLLTQAESQLGNDKKDVKLVTTAYRTFAARVKVLKKKLDEKLPTLSSPVPSPDINAPSPSPDSDIELPGNDTNTNTSGAGSPSPNATALFSNPGYYNPVPAPITDSNTNFNNNFSSFMGTNMSFNLPNFNTTSLFGTNASQNTTANATSQPQTTNSYSINDAISTLFPAIACPPPPPAPNINNTTHPGNDYQYGNATHVPLMPPPMPPFNKSDDNYNVSSYGDTYNGNNNSNYPPTYEPISTPYQPTTTPYEPSDNNLPHYQSATTPYDPHTPTYQSPTPTTAYEPSFNANYPPPLVPPSFQNTKPPIQSPNTSYPPPLIPLAAPYAPADEYNPEEELETWEPEPTWEQPPVEVDTPESPPMFEKEGYGDPVEYHDANTFEGAEDVDHRVLPSLMVPPVHADEKGGHRSKDVDHRNLISLTGSPSEVRSRWTSQGDQDYRKPVNSANLDQDYRVPFNIENFKLPPPPPPPKMLSNQNTGRSSFNTNVQLETSMLLPEQLMVDRTMPPPNFDPGQKPMHPKRHGFSPRKLQDNNESIDMDLSDDEHEMNMKEEHKENQPDMGVLRNLSPENSDCFELPPPFPDLVDDLDANKFLDNVTEDLDLDEFEPVELDYMDQANSVTFGLLGHGPPPAFPVGFGNLPNPMFSELPLMPNNMMQEPEWKNPQEFLNSQEFGNQNREFTFRGRGNFNNRGGGPPMRGSWGNGNGGNNRGEFRGGRGSRGGPRMRGGNQFRGGNFGGPEGRGRGGRGRGGGRGRVGDGGRGRGDFRGRGNFRGNFRGGF